MHCIPLLLLFTVPGSVAYLPPPLPLSLLFLFFCCTSPLQNRPFPPLGGGGGGGVCVKMNNIIETSIAIRQLSKILDILVVGKFLNSRW